MNTLANIRKAVLFGVLGAIGCLAGWLIGEGFLWVSMPSSKDAGTTSLASKPELPALAKKVEVSAPPPPALVGADLSFTRSRPTPPPPSLPAGSTKSAPAAPAPPALAAATPGKAAPPPPEFAQRLEQAGAKSGDAQITLIWFNGNDLDLHCIEPSNEEIFYARRRSRNGGELDIDMNASGAVTTKPVENIYWPKGKAPMGKYRVFVNHYANHGGKDPTDYKVSILIGSKRQEFSGQISRGQPKRLITTFDVNPSSFEGSDTPELRLAVSPELIVNQGTKNQLRIRLARSNAPGPVTVRLDGDLNGISPRAFQIPASDSDGIAEIAADSTAAPGERVISVKASTSTLNADASFRLIVKQQEPELRVAVSPELIVTQGGQNKLLVRIARGNLPGPVTCRFTGELAGLGAKDFVIAGNETEGSTEISADAATPTGTRTLTMAATSGLFRAETSFKLTVIPATPELRLAVSPSLIVNQGGNNRMTMRVGRFLMPGPIQVRRDGDLRGIETTQFTFGAAENEISALINAAGNAPPGERTLKAIATCGDSSAEATFRLMINDVGPKLRLAVPGTIQIAPGGENQLPVRIGRDRFTGPVVVRLAGDVEGVSPREFTIPADKDDAEVTLSAEASLKGTHDLLVLASSGDVRAEGTLQVVAVSPANTGPQWSWWMVFVIGMWTSLLTFGLSLALVMGQNRYLARPWLSLGEFAALVGGSLLAGLVAGGLGQSLYGLLTYIRFWPEIGFVLGWLVLGSLLGRGLVFFIPNLSAWRAVAAGSCGGLLGALAFIAVSFVGDMAGRFMGAAILGLALGLMVAIVESAFRKIWLEVVDESGAVRVVNLGTTPVILGGDGRWCTVTIAGAPGRALKFWEEKGQVYCLDILAEKTNPVAPGYRPTLKNVDVVVCSNEQGRTPPPKKATKPVVENPPVTNKPKATPTPPIVKPPVVNAPPKASPPNPAPTPVVKPPVVSAPPKASPPKAPPPKAPQQEKAEAQVEGPCPVCVKKITGTPWKRRCTDCWTTF